MAASTKKKTPSSKDSKNKRIRITSSNPSLISRELWAVILFCSAFFTLVCNLFPEATGLLGYAIITVFSKVVGYQGLLYMPLFVAIPGVALLATRTLPKIIYTATFISFLCFLVLLEKNVATAVSLMSIPKVASTTSGWLGSVTLFIMNKLLGSYGTILAVSGVFIGSTILVFGLSLKRMFIYLNSVFDSIEIVIPVGKESNTSPFYNSLKKWSIRAYYFLFFKKSNPDSTPLPFDDILEDISNTLEPTPSLSPEPESFELPDMDTEEPEPIAEKKQKKAPKKKPIQDAVTILDDDVDTFTLPPMSLLNAGAKTKTNTKELAKQHKEQSEVLEMTLESFNVKAAVVNVTAGPSVTRFELKPGEGVKIAKITSLAKDIALKLAAPDIRIEAPIPGKALVGIEVPNSNVEMITIRGIMEANDFCNLPSHLMTVLGLTITGEAILMDLAKMPHVLIAGATGSGKSVCINAIILSILMKARPDEVKFLMIDPKKVELSLYQDIPHLIAPVVTNPHKAAATLKKWALIEMETRYEQFSKVGVKDIKGYNEYVEKELARRKKEAEKEAVKKAAIESALAEGEELEDDTPEKLPYIIVVIDELADLMMVAAQDVETTICRLAQMARATGIHLVIATQRPSVNVVTGLIKANVPSRVSFFLQSQIDSRTILDMPGAEKLLGKGDMLYSPVGSFKPKRAQGVFVSESEVKGVVDWLRKQGKPDYDSDIIDVEPLSESSSSGGSDDNQDELYEDAKQLVMSTQYASTSYLQRKLRIGYNRAARIMDELTENGIIAEYAGEKKPRSVSSQVDT